MFLFVLFVLVTTTAGDTPQVQPHKKIKLSDSYLAVSVQVLSHVEDSLNETAILHGYRLVYISESNYDDLDEGNSNYTEEFNSLDDQLVPEELLLIRLKDILAAEARLKGLGGYNGFTDSVLSELLHSSNTTAKEQVDNVIKTMLQREHNSWRQGIILSRYLIHHLAKDQSKLSALLSSISPLKYT